MLNPRNESALIVQNGLIKAARCVFDGYQLLSMLGYDPKLLPCVCFLMIGVLVCVCVCRCMNAWGCIDILSQWDLWETGAGGLSSPLLFLKQMHLQLALSEEREGKHAGRRGNMFRERRVNGA